METKAVDIEHSIPNNEIQISIELYNRCRDHCKKRAMSRAQLNRLLFGVFLLNKTSDSYDNEISRYIINKGIDIKTIASQIIDPTKSDFNEPGVIQKTGDHIQCKDIDLIRPLAFSLEGGVNLALKSTNTMELLNKILDIKSGHSVLLSGIYAIRYLTTRLASGDLDLSNYYLEEEYLGSLIDKVRGSRSVTAETS